MKTDNRQDKSTKDAIKEMLKAALSIYEVPDGCVNLAMSYIDGLKTGALSEKHTTADTRQ